MIIEAEIKGIKDNQIWFASPLTREIENALDVSNGKATVEISDGRKISNEQRRKSYLLINYISNALGYTPTEVIKEMTKLLYTASGATIQFETFSLSDCDMTTARHYIDFLVKFCIENGIECGEPLYKLCEDLEKYTYYCLMNRICAVCGATKVDLHHTEAVGMGRNRKDIVHIGMKCLPLCRKCHNKAHKMGKDSFLERYALVPIEINERIAKRYRLKRGGK